MTRGSKWRGPEWSLWTTAERNAAIVAAAREGKTMREIARHVGLTADYCRQIVKWAKIKAKEHPCPPS